MMSDDDDNEGQMLFGDLGGIKLSDICLTDEEKPRKNLTQQTCPDRGSNPGPLLDRSACYRLSHSGGSTLFSNSTYFFEKREIFRKKFKEYFRSVDLTILTKSHISD